MKKLFVLLFISLLIVTPTSAATTISTDITTTGKVGIGSTTPYAKLSIDATMAPTGPELITNGTFTGGTTGWTLGNNVTYGDNNVVSTYAGGDPSVSTTFDVVSGRMYLISYTLSNVGNNALVYYWLSNVTRYNDPPSGNGTYSFVYRSTYTGSETITFDIWTYSSGSTWTLDNVSIKETTDVSPAFTVIDHTGETLLSLGADLIGNMGIGISSLKSNTTGYYNVGYGQRTLYSNTTGSNNTAIGESSLISNTTGQANLAVGTQSMFGNITGFFNTASGAYSLGGNTTGSNNTVSGFSTHYRNKTGSNNVATGYYSAFYNTSATNTTAIGSEAAIGTSPYSNQGGVYLGYGSGYSAGNSSDYNTLIGYRSGYGITTGKNNIVLGTATSSTSVNNITTGSQNILIGNNIGLPSSTASGQLNIGNIIYGTGITSTGTTVSSGNIGIGTTTPTTKLHVTSGASATTTVTIGSLGLTTSKGCVNMNQIDGSAGSFYLRGGTLVVEANYCR